MSEMSDSNHSKLENDAKNQKIITIHQLEHTSVGGFSCGSIVITNARISESLSHCHRDVVC
jgi:hypothetical protein